MASLDCVKLFKYCLSPQNVYLSCFVGLVDQRIPESVFVPLSGSQGLIERVRGSIPQHTPAVGPDVQQQNPKVSLCVLQILRFALSAGNCGA